MGIVVAAHHEQLDQRVALKFLLPAVVQNEEIVQRFLREARAAVKIHSEHVARVFDVGKHGELPYMVMEYLEGSDIAQTLVERGPLPPREAAGYLLEVCDAVAEAHALGIVHRDLKPANLFLATRPTGRRTVKVLDFGISKAPVTERERNLTDATAIMGSPSYMSPEQLVASASVDVRSDIWSLGVVLFEMVTRQLPFNATSMPELVGVILQVSPRLDDVPAEVRSIVERCLHKERERRYSTIAELARALAPIAPSRYQPLVERIEGVFDAAPPSSRPAQSVTPQRDRDAAPDVIGGRTLGPTTTAITKSRQPFWIAALAALAIAGAVGSIAIVRQRAPAAAPPGTSSASASATPTNAPSTPVTSSTPVASSAPVVFAPSASAPAPVRSATVTAAGTRPAIHTPSATATESSSPAPIASPSASQGGCKTVSYFDESGNKHFRLDCP
jgi:serine/threonine-protein kinase